MVCGPPFVLLPGPCSCQGGPFLVPVREVWARPFPQHRAQDLHVHRGLFSEGIIQSSVDSLALGWVRGSLNLHCSPLTDGPIPLMACGWAPAWRVQRCYVWFYKGARLKGTRGPLSSPHSAAKPCVCCWKRALYCDVEPALQRDLFFSFSRGKWAFAKSEGVFLVGESCHSNRGVLSSPRLWEGRIFGFLALNSPLLLSFGDA